MSLHPLRAARLGVVTLGAVGALAAGASAASATTIRQGTATTLPSSSSAAVASGTQIGATSLAGAATYTTPQTSGSCGTGQLSATVGTNPASPTVALTAPTLGVAACTGGTPSYDIVQFDLTNSPAVAVRYVQSAAPQGTVSLAGATFRVRFRLTSGLFTSCNLVPVTDPVVGHLRNGSPAGGVPGTQPSLAFGALRLRSASQSTICRTEFGGGTSASDVTTLSATYQPLRTLPASGTGSYIGIFA